jgi:NTP pyrophosphatase (non-canonical NTP hydrolase)
MNIKELCTQAYNATFSKGFWDNPRTNLECYALIHSEISEAVEEARTNTPAMYVSNETNKPEGQLVELADAVIRIADLCGRHGWDLETAIKLKMKYNEGRERLHGKLK